jgi:hypothetical protein
MSRLRPILIFPILILASFVPVGAVITLAETNIDQYTPVKFFSGMAGHPGEICVACHTRFSKDRPYASELPINVSNNAVLHIYPCYKSCHFVPPTVFKRTGTTRWSMHMGICINCHPRWGTSVETIHNTHGHDANLTFKYLLLNRTPVECKLCHANPQGFNSSIVQVPPFPGDGTAVTGEIIKPDWKDDCSYCHFTIIGAQRVHDVHEPVLLTACPICHSAYILRYKKYFDRIDFPFPSPIEKEPPPPPTIEDKLIATVTTNRSIISPEKTPSPTADKPIPILSEFYLYFDGILEELLDFYNLVV